MHLHQLRAKIAATWDEHWNHIQGGPMFNYNLGTINDVATVAGWHSARAVLQEDVDIAIEYGMPDSAHRPNQDWVEEWSAFPDDKIRGEYADVFYRGSLVDRVHLASVDGGRAVLPLPDRREGQWIVLDWPYQVGRIVHELSCPSESFEDYFRRSGITKWPA
jgi:hypothetical protein